MVGQTQFLEHLGKHYIFVVCTDNEGLGRDARKCLLFSLVYMRQDHGHPQDM